MNDVLDENVLDDEPIIARLRNALDELTAPSPDGEGEVPVRSPRTMTTARWVAVAAAAVLVVGATAAVMVNRGNQGDTASPPTSVAPTLPATTEPVLIRVETPFFTIASPDLVPGERTFEQCCRTDALLSMAWSNGDDYLMLTEYPISPVIELFPELASTLSERENATLLFRSVGLTQMERDRMADQVVPGSGLPYVLPVDGWTIAAMGYTQGEGRLLQLYTPLNTDPLSSYLPQVVLSVGEYRGELDWLARWPDPVPVQVAGYAGWKVTEADGTVKVFWSVGQGNWATMRVDALLAVGTDDILARITEIDPTAPVEDVEVASGPAAVGRLEIPSLELDWIVVDPGSDADEAKKAGPVLLEGLPPGDAGGVTVIWGHRTAYGAPFFRLDELRPGDEITWTTELGAVTLEVIEVRIVDGLDATPPVKDSTTLQLVTYHPKYGYSPPQTLVVSARTVD